MRQATDPVSITLEAQQWNVVIGALMDVPWRYSDAILRAIRAQTEQDQQQLPVTTDAPPVKLNGAGEAVPALPN